MKTALAILAVTLGGCGASVEQSQQAPERKVVNATVYVESSFTETQKSQIVAAMDEWEQRGMDAVHLTAVFADDATIRAMTNVPNVVRMIHQTGMYDVANGLCPLSDEASQIDPLGQTATRSGVLTVCIVPIDVDGSMGLQDTRLVTEHELGHVFGLVHEAGTMMAPELNTDILHLTDKDISQFCNHWDCAKGTR